MSSAPPLSHLVALPLAGWGHTRPLVALLLNLVLIHPTLRCTVLTIPSYTERIQAQLDRSSSATPQPRANGQTTGRIRVMPLTSERDERARKLSGFDPRYMEDHAREMGGVLPPILERLYHPTVSDEESSWGGPRVFIYDAFHREFGPALDRVLQCARVRGMDIDRPSRVMFFPCNVSSAYNTWCTAEEGSDLARAIQWTDQLKKDKGMTEAEAMGEVWMRKTGYVMRTPGLAPVYDWEQFPQLGSLPAVPQFMSSLRALYSQKDTCNAFVFPWDPEMEAEVIQAFERSTGKTCYAVGMQFPPESWDGIKPEGKEEDRAIVQWLDRFPTGSVLYISFGSLLWPGLRPDLLIHLISSLIETGLPFLFVAGASPFANISDELGDLVESYGEKGMMVDVAPQEVVLAHHAVGFFLSHMGSNSVGESILAGKPMIAWPFMGDQPEITQQMIAYGCAMELLQIRTSGIGKQTYSGTLVFNTTEAIRNEMRDVWRIIRGERGHQMRRNVDRLREDSSLSRKEGGAKRAMEGFAEIWT